MKSSFAWNSPHYRRLFIWPAIVTMVAIVILPTLFLWYVSLTSYDLGQGWENRHFVGVANFIELLSGQDREFWTSVVISLLYMLASTSIEFVAGFGVAVLFDRRIPLKRLWMSCLLVPLTITPSVVAMMWKLMYNNEYGVLNYILGLLRLGVNWLDPMHALLSCVLVDVWQWTPFVALILYAGLQSLPQEPYEAAVVDGANPWQVFRFITVPMMKPMITIALLLRSIDSLKVFDTVYGLTQGGPGTATELLSLHIYRLGFQHTGWIGRSSAAAVLLLLLTSVLATYLLKAFRQQYQGGVE